MRIYLIFTILISALFCPDAEAQVAEFFRNTRVIYERTNVSETSTLVYDSNGRPMGRFNNTPIEVPTRDQVIAASIAPDGSRIMQETLNRNMIIRNTPAGPMVRVAVSSYSGYVAERSAYDLGGSTSNSFGPRGDTYVPLSEFTSNKFKARGLAAGAVASFNLSYARFQNALRPPSGSFVTSPALQAVNDPHNIQDTRAPINVSPSELVITPPTCDCARGPRSCSVSSRFGLRARPSTTNGRRGSSDHRGIDITGGQGTTLVAPDRVVVQSAMPFGNYGNRVILRSLTHTSPQIYYAYNHLPNGLRGRPTFMVSTGQELQPGDQIGVMGATGQVTGPHLHFEIYRLGLDPKVNTFDPMPNIRLGAQRLSLTNEIVGLSCTDLRSRIRNSNGSGAGAASAANR